MVNYRTRHRRCLIIFLFTFRLLVGRIIALVTRGDSEVARIADHVIEVHRTDDALVPMLSTVPLQLLSYHIAVMLDRNVDQPRNLAKSVTVE